MKLAMFALAAAMLAAPALAQDVTPPSDTVKAVVEAMNAPIIVWA